MTVPGNVGGLVPDGPDWLVRAVRELQREVAMLRTAASLQAATIGAGGLTIADGGSFKMTAADGTLVVHMGEVQIPDGSGRTQMSSLFARDDGTTAFALTDAGTTNGHTHQQALQWYDRNGGVVFADDTNGSKGIAAPHMQQSPLVDGDVTTWPKTSSTSWSTIAGVRLNMWQPGVYWQAGCAAGSGATANFRLVLSSDGTVIASGPSVTAGAFVFWSAQWYPSTWNTGDELNVDIQAKVGNTSGTAYFNFYQLYGIGSP